MWLKCADRTAQNYDMKKRKRKNYECNKDMKKEKIQRRKIILNDKLLLDVIESVQLDSLASEEQFVPLTFPDDLPAPHTSKEERDGPHLTQTPSKEYTQQGTHWIILIKKST